MHIFICKEVGYSLYKKQSTIEHHDAGDGVFLHCPSSQFVLPGTLLGFVPGVIFSRYDQYPEKGEKDKWISYFKRYDETIIDFSEKIPYPVNFGQGMMFFSLSVFIE